jgi:glucose-1-phosphate thymidylyltransferase
VKAIVLARGKGTRMQRRDAAAGADPAQARMADAGLKAMIPFRRPFLDYVLSALADTAFTEVCLVIGPAHDLVREYYTQAGRPTRVHLSFAIQHEARGTADALLMAEPFAADDEFIVLNADNYYPLDVLRGLAGLEGPGLPAFRRSALVRLSNIEPERVRNYAVLRISSEGRLLDIIEKPDQATLAAYGEDPFISMNCWRFGGSIFSACRRIRPSARGELELPEAVRYAVTVMGERLQTFPIEAGVLDLSHRGDIAEVERRLAHLAPDP